MKKQIKIIIDIDDKINECKEMIEANKLQSSPIEELSFNYYSNQLEEYLKLKATGQINIERVVDKIKFKPKFRNEDYEY